MTIGILLLLVVAGSFIWVANDSAQKGLNQWWAVGVLLFWIVFFPWYLVIRQRAGFPCPHCRKIPRAGATVCHHCGREFVRPGDEPEWTGVATTASSAEGRWEPDPRNPETMERWREGERWTSQTRPRS